MPSNLRILQWQVCKRKHNKPEFVVPWWDLQLGISVNQFLSIFASSNSDFRFVYSSFSSFDAYCSQNLNVDDEFLFTVLAGTGHFHTCSWKAKKKK